MKSPAAVLLLCCIASNASAHAILMRGTPAIGGTVPPGTLAIDLHYNSLIDAKRSRLTLIGPDGEEHRLKIAAGANGDELLSSTPVSPGASRLRWQVLAIDGHITRGDVPFTVK